MSSRLIIFVMAFLGVDDLVRKRIERLVSKLNNGTAYNRWRVCTWIADLEEK